MGDEAEMSSDLSDDRAGGSSQSQMSVNKLASSNSQFIIEIKDLIATLNKKVNADGNKNKLNQKDRSDFIELTDRIFLACMKREAYYLNSDNRISELEEQIKSREIKVGELEYQIQNRDITLEGIDLKLQKFVDLYNENQTKLTDIIGNIAGGELEDKLSTPKNTIRDESPVLVIDTNEESTAMSYRDALISAAPELDFPKPDDLVIPRANRLIVKMSNSANLTKFKELLDNDPNLKKMAQTKISKTRKHRLILFGVPDSVSDEDFISELMALGETMGKPIDLIKSFKNGANGSDMLHTIVHRKLPAPLVQGATILDSAPARLKNA
ncbi:hypothetical protein JTE90_013063 [Oedothorax gibbosus]|uniref:Uncharacterized protein n=1 Tax=Oedothorax gibbosus TaxID=931172 RepID=A0AAV6TI99_9ARAC|nr:hypothetical protein JTE90_013063 [Oedothorax gibbosus]